MNLGRCHNFHDFRRLARARLPGPIFDYIEGAADDETTFRRNTTAFEGCDLVPNVLAGVDQIDMSVTVMGQKLAMPVYCSPTALQRLYHHEGERAVATAAEKFGTMFGVSTLGTPSSSLARASLGDNLAFSSPVSVELPHDEAETERTARSRRSSPLVS